MQQQNPTRRRILRHAASAGGLALAGYALGRFPAVYAADPVTLRIATATFVRPASAVALVAIGTP